jgi:hypothetical protein
MSAEFKVSNIIAWKYKLDLKNNQGEVYVL